MADSCLRPGRGLTRDLSVLGWRSHHGAARPGRRWTVIDDGFLVFAEPVPQTPQLISESRLLLLLNLRS